MTLLLLSVPVNKGLNPASALESAGATVLAILPNSLYIHWQDKPRKEASQEGKQVVIIRAEQPEDVEEIRQINRKAFGAEAEANLVDALRASGIPCISLVAEDGNRLIGYILFSPVTLDGDTTGVALTGLAPMAVLPDWQNKGVGSTLVEEGLRLCKQAGYTAVVVLGHPEFYPRFGFVPSEYFGITSEYDVPADVFMIREFHDGALDGCGGIIRYHCAFSDV